MHNGPYGYHVCLVFEFLGISLESLLKEECKGMLRPEVVRGIAAQLGIGLSFLHEQCGITHCNLKPENILIKLPEKIIVILKGRSNKHR